MVRRQRSAYFSTTLSSGVDASTTSWTVASATGMPAEGDFYAHCESEIVLVTHRSGTTLTVIRGCCGTTGAAHASAKAFHSILVAEEYEQRMIERGRRQVLAHGLLLDSSDTILTASDFTWINQVSGTRADMDDGTIAMFQTLHAGNDLSGQARGTFSTGTDRRFTCHLSGPIDTQQEQFHRMGLYAQENSSGFMRGIEFISNSTSGTSPAVACRERVTFGSGGTTVASHNAGRRYDIWLQMDLLWEVSGSTDNFICRYSYDGVHFFALHTFAFDSGATWVAWVGNNRHVTGSSPIYCNAWKEEIL